ncbi:hypothetical protein ACHOLT_00735 [Desulfitobacterium sp. Sab5]
MTLKILSAFTDLAKVLGILEEIDSHQTVKIDKSSNDRQENRRK